MKKLFTVIVLCAGLNMGYAGGDDLPIEKAPEDVPVDEVSEAGDAPVDEVSEAGDAPVDETSESDDFIEISVDVGQTLIGVKFLLSKAQFSRLIDKEVEPLTEVFNIRTPDTQLFGDNIVFSAVIDENIYHNIGCDVDVHMDGTMSFMDCQNDEVSFENKDIVVNFSSFNGPIQFIYNDGVVFKQNKVKQLKPNTDL
ncbi:MAG: hypothetical protein OXK80_02520 [Bdellovibrionales bacterium]|nr:hypothetical protein [Bdellovibrionales bacterium]